MSKHKHLEAAREYARKEVGGAESILKNDLAQRAFLAGADYVEKVNKEVVVKTFQNYWDENAKRIWESLNGKELCEEVWKAALEIGKKLEREKLQAENKALRSDLEWAMSFAPKEENLTEGMAPMFYHTLTYEGDLKLNERAQQIRTKYFKEEALKEQGGGDD